MWNTYLFPLAIISAIIIPTQCIREEGLQCISSTGKSQKIDLSINLNRSECGEWDTKFSAERNGSLSLEMVDVNLSQDVIECSSHRIISIRGEIKGNSRAPLRPRLLFHKKCSPNAVIANGGRSLHKKISNQAATAFTERPLMDEEVFRVSLDKKNPSYAVIIGVTSHPPGSIGIPDHFYEIRTGTWLFIHTDLYTNGSISNKNYVKSHLNDAKAGDVFGVMRSKYGSLHLFVNGVDQGPAAPIPENVYGVFELYGGGLEGTIIDYSRNEIL